MKKYELTDETRIVDGKPHYRIRALRGISRYDVRKGDLGGWISGEHNLSQWKDCWVAGDALVSDAAVVTDNAYISGNATVLGSAKVANFASVEGDALIKELAYVSGWAYISNRACISGSSCVSAHAYVYDDARVLGSAEVSGEAHVYGESVIRDDTYVGGSSHILGTSIIKDDARVFGNGRINSSIVGGNAWLDGKLILSNGVTIEGDTGLKADLHLSADKHPIHLKHDKDIYVFKNNWSSGRTFCYIPNIKLWIVGCFKGTSDELIKKAYADSKHSGDMYSSYVELVERLESKR